jgi:ComF family protein
MGALLDGLLDLLFPTPPRCAVCGRELGRKDEREPFCSQCRQRLVQLPPFVCRKCGKPIPALGYLCADCAVTRHYFERCRAVGVYASVMQECIYRFKYDGKRQLAGPLGKLMADKLVGEGLPLLHAVVSVPLFPGKEAARGYNQAALLADAAAPYLRLPVIRHNLVRIRDTPSQTWQSRAARQANIRGAFAVRQPEEVGGKRLLLVDDIYTTGSTMSECARMLLTAGAEAVEAIVLAVGQQ